MDLTFICFHGKIYYLFFALNKVKDLKSASYLGETED